MMKKVYKVFLIATVSIVALALAFVFVVLYSFFGPDRSDFGRTHPIPDGLEYNMPLTYDSEQTAVVDSNNPDAFLQLWNGLQGGNYFYDFYYGPLPAGEIYLRCYEVTENIPLSESRLQQATAVVTDATTSFSQLVKHKEFTIYEGVWGEYYAARVEVWFKNAETSQESKLLEKVYRVEGWQR